MISFNPIKHSAIQYKRQDKNVSQAPQINFEGTLPKKVSPRLAWSLAGLVALGTITAGAVKVSAAGRQSEPELKTISTERINDLKEAGKINTVLDLTETDYGLEINGSSDGKKIQLVINKDVLGTFLDRKISLDNTNAFLVDTYTGDVDKSPMRLWVRRDKVTEVKDIFQKENTFLKIWNDQQERDMIGTFHGVGLNMKSIFDSGVIKVNAEINQEQASGKTDKEVTNLEIYKSDTGRKVVGNIKGDIASNLMIILASLTDSFENKGDYGQGY